MPSSPAFGNDEPTQPAESGGRLLAGRYQLITSVGRGAMGTVWHARDEMLERDVAVKEVILSPDLGAEERATQYRRTFREARTAARLSHPGVVRIYDVVEENGRPWIVMELVRARALDEVIEQEGPLPPRRAAEIGRQMLEALHAAHEAGVLHRDVKPSNVLLAAGSAGADRVVLTDFGIATAMGDATLTQAGLVIGSPAYIPPERLKGEKGDRASDLWSLGVTLYALVEGHSPYERTDAMACMAAVLTEEPAPAPHAGPLRPVIEGLLRKDPAERLTAEQAAVLLGGIVRGEQVAVPRPARRTRAAQAATQALPAPRLPGDDLVTETKAVRAPAGRSTTRIWLIGAMVLVAVAGAVLLALGGKSLKDAFAGSGRGAAGRSSGSPATSATALPAGYVRYPDPTGFSVGLPAEASTPERRSNGVFFFSRNRRSYVQIGQTTTPGDNALADWQEQERSAQGARFRAYQRLRLESIPYKTSPTAADWEFTWDNGQGRMHGLDRGFVLNGRGYAIFIVAPDSEWDQVMNRLRPVFDTFVPAP